MSISQEVLDGEPLPKLTDTPLRDITREFGAKGLEQRFRAEVDQKEFSLESKERIFDTLTLALRLHVDDKRGDLPYSTHFLRVATRIIAYYDVRDENMIIAALLHDTVEDHPQGLIEMLTAPQSSIGINVETDLQALALTAIGDRFNEEVASIVGGVTNPILLGRPPEERRARYHTHVRETLLDDMNPKARIIKIADLEDNLGGQKHNPSPTDRKRRLQKYAPLIPDVIEAIQQPDTPLTDDVKEYLVRKFTSYSEFAQQELAV